ncbi:hypothetical protein FD755_012268 [Muntiacus reevesi]|uniref:Large ribosomal subunit protein eL36 n=1 Tax=Muntiacus reevesi TaxID=9886 RepID=A0A5N3XNK6_MUNRE|nr:hypothetical protein FD755_012268 [Muntiacus reevesi]
MQLTATALCYPMIVGVSKAYKMTKNVSHQSYGHCDWGHLTKNKPHDLRAGLKCIKKRVGTHTHAKKKGEELSNVLVITRKVTAKCRAPSSL